MTQYFEGRYRLHAVRTGSKPYKGTGYVHDGDEIKPLASVEAPGEYENPDDAYMAGIDAARAEARKLIEAAGSDA